MRVFLKSFKPRFSTITIDKIHVPELKTTHLVLNNVKKRNTLSMETMVSFRQKLKQVINQAHEKKTKMLVLRAQGPVFSSGHDLKELASASDPGKIFQECAELMMDLKNMPIPTLGVVNGIAAAAGFQLAMTCDMLIASDKSSFSCPGVKWGLFCSTPGVQLIRTINSQKKAMQLLFTGQALSAQQAYQYGLLNRVVPQEKLSTTVQQFATKILNLSGQVISLGKAAFLKQAKQREISNAYKIATDAMQGNILESSDCKIGLDAFANKKHPQYKN